MAEYKLINKVVESLAGIWGQARAAANDRIAIPPDNPFKGNNRDEIESLI